MNPLIAYYEYYGIQNIVYLNSLTGGISKDPALLGICGVIAFFLFFPLLFSFHRGWYLFFLIVLFIGQWVVLRMIDSPSIGQLIYDSIVYCQNYWLLAWLIGQGLFVILSLIFLIKSNTKV